MGGTKKNSIIRNTVTLKLIYIGGNVLSIIKSEGLQNIIEAQGSHVRNYVDVTWNDHKQMQRQSSAVHSCHAIMRAKL